MLTWLPVRNFCVACPCIGHSGAHPFRHHHHQCHPLQLLSSSCLHPVTPLQHQACHIPPGMPAADKLTADPSTQGRCHLADTPPLTSCKGAAMGCCCQSTSMHLIPILVQCPTPKQVSLNHSSQSHCQMRPVVDTSQPQQVQRLEQYAPKQQAQSRSSSNVKQCLPCTKGRAENTVLQRSTQRAAPPQSHVGPHPCPSLPTAPTGQTQTTPSSQCCCSALLRSEVRKLRLQMLYMGPSHSAGRSHWVTPVLWLW